MSKLVVMLTSMAGAFESYAPGDKLLVSDEVADAWVGGGIAQLHADEPEKVKELGKAADTEEIKHLGGGVYELPNGEKVRGRDKAQEALDALKAQEAEMAAQEGQEAGDLNGVETGSTTGEGAGDASGNEGVSAG